MSKKSFIFGVILGAIAGVVASRTYFKKKYEEYADSEIKEVVDHFKKELNKWEEKIHRECTEIISGDTSDKEDNDNSDEEDEPFHLYKHECDIDKKTEPFIISDEEFGDIYEYDTVFYTYFEDDEVLVDENYEPNEDWEANIGVEWRDIIDKTGQVFVRNDRLRLDYEIAKEEGSYRDFLLERYK